MKISQIYPLFLFSLVWALQRIWLQIRRFFVIFHAIKRCPPPLGVLPCLLILQEILSMDGIGLSP
jgi:hypothetical protein